MAIGFSNVLVPLKRFLRRHQLIRDLNANAAQVSPGIAELELQGRIRREAGGLLALTT